MKISLKFGTVLLCVFVCVSAWAGLFGDDCEPREDIYNEGYLDALACVQREGGSASAAARTCENE